jgi:hypothetical protein
MRKQRYANKCENKDMQIKMMCTIGYAKYTDKKLPETAIEVVVQSKSGTILPDNYHLSQVITLFGSMESHLHRAFGMLYCEWVIFGLLLGEFWTFIWSRKWLFSTG